MGPSRNRLAISQPATSHSLWSNLIICLVSCDHWSVRAQLTFNSHKNNHSIDLFCIYLFIIHNFNLNWQVQHVPLQTAFSYSHWLWQLHTHFTLCGTALHCTIVYCYCTLNTIRQSRYQLELQLNIRNPPDQQIFWRNKREMIFKKEIQFPTINYEASRRRWSTRAAEQGGRYGAITLREY